MDFKLEVVVIPVSDVDRAKEFYQRMGWREDADFVSGEDFRVIQMTPPGSPCSGSAASLARALPRAAQPPGRHEWPDRYAELMVRERAVEELPI